MWLPLVDNWHMSRSHPDLLMNSAVILGGAHGSLALARSLAKLDVKVFYITNDNPLTQWSRHIKKTIFWSGPQTANAAEEILQIAKSYDLTGALLIPAGDQDVKFVSQNTKILSSTFALITPEWEQLRWLCDKPNLYKRAAELQIAHPTTYKITALGDIHEQSFRFPVVLKPNMGGGNSALAKAKVIRVDDKPSLIKVYVSASRELGAENIVIQRLIPGDGDTQLSYAAFWHKGTPIGEFTAQRSRQYPVDFGFTSTFVETINSPEAIDAARKILSSVHYSGLVEVEFKRDLTDGSLNILDVNPRPWSWFALSSVTSSNLTTMLWDAVNNRAPQPEVLMQRNAAWIYLSRDIIAATILISRRKLKLRTYLASLLKVKAWAAFSWSDLKPGFADLPITVYRVLKRRIFN